MRCWLFLLIILITLTFNSANAKQNNADMDIFSLRKSIALGDIRFEVTSKNAAAKEHFLLGAAFLHSFMYDLAILQFQQAQKLDPGFGMSYWGEAMAYKHPIWNNENLAGAQKVLLRYKKHKDARSLTKKEQYYLQAIDVLFSKKSLFERDTEYMLLMQKFYKSFSNDPNIAAFYALSLMGIASDFPEQKHSQQYMKQGLELINALFIKFPNHPGVVHYYLHYHDSADFELAKQALPAAKIALKLMKSSSHVTHMSAHIYRRLELWEDYILANQISVEAANQLCKTLKDYPLYACNAENKYHSLEWLHDGYLKKQQFEQANALVKQMEQVVSLDSDVIYKQWYYRMWARQILLTQNWQQSSIKIEPISKLNDQLYWSAYSECGALLASSFLDIHHNKSVTTQLKRLDTIIQYINTLEDPYIRQTCQIAKIEIQTEAARQKKETTKANDYLNKALHLQKNQISTELTPSLSFLPAEQYYQNYILQSENHD